LYKGGIEVSTSEQNTTSSTHKITDKVIQILKRNPNISDAELAEQAGLKSEAAARGWRAVAEDTMRGWKWGY
jgi:predicted HTH transcriptional regulator